MIFLLPGIKFRLDRFFVKLFSFKVSGALSDLPVGSTTDDLVCLHVDGAGSHSKSLESPFLQSGSMFVKVVWDHEMPGVEKCFDVIGKFLECKSSWRSRREHVGESTGLTPFLFVSLKWFQKCPFLHQTVADSIAIV